MKNTAASLLQMKRDGQRITEITAYDYSTAKIMETAGVNAILVGDSLGMTMLGYDTTLPVTLEDMIHHSAAVARACTDTLVIMDMPFMSYQTGVRDAVLNAGHLMKEARGHAVKLEGGAAVAEQIRAITDAGIPVQAHIGMTPQSVNVFGGFKVQGKGEEAAKRLLEDAYIVQEAGAFSVVLECVPPKLAALISRKLMIPTIGIGAGAGCDGQVLVYQDMLGMNLGFTPRFAKKFADVGQLMIDGVKDYIREVQEGTFPQDCHSFVKSDCSDEYLATLEQTLGKE
ncbi:MAG: 3-methyl-2-oxobutanoate hydroxymethyltransferase [Clostridiales bacterium]|nr:3-methyl-2-oxobutanoate hydroxymethyltransferase [Clostridiales bacterium]